MTIQSKTLATYLKLSLRIAAALSVAAALSIQTSVAKEELKLKTEKVAGSVYMLSGVGPFTGGNIGLSIGDDGVAMIDNGIPELTDVLVKQIEENTPHSVDFLINTHVHGDHTGNNAHFGEKGSHIISHINLRRSMQADEKNTKDALPVLTYTDRMTVHLNGDDAQLIHYANAHTDGDSVVHFKQANVIHTGDILFNGLFPYIDADNGGSLDGVIAALSAIEAMANAETKIIPGHGPLASKADITRTIAMLKDAKDLVVALVSAGKTDEEILQLNPLEKYQDYNWGFITTERMTKQVLLSARQ